MSIVKTVRVKVPPKSLSPSLSNPRRIQCNHLSSCCSTQLLIQNHSNFKRSSAPSRFLFYEDGSWVGFPDDVVRILRSSFLEGKSMAEILIDESRYLFDFLRMLQIDFASGNQRSISWIDDNGKCFFPKVFVCEENLEETKIEIEIRIDGDSNSVKRKKEIVEEQEKEEQSEGSSSNNNQENLSKRRRVVTSALETSRWPNTKLIKEGDRAYSLVKKFFLSGVSTVDPGATITSIYQCTRRGPLEKARFEVFKKQVEITKAARGAANTIFAWYGTSAEGVNSILMHGFGMPSKVSCSEAHGVGVYLSPVSLPQMSAMQSEADDNGEKHVILCRVILGSVEKVEAGSQQSHPSSVNFDTGVDDLKNPKRYVVWCANMNSHILPECVVSYKSSDLASGQLRGSVFMRWIPNASNSYVTKLFSKLESSLPSEKVRELENLCSTYKIGKMPKDVFIKNLRSIAGDELMRSTIREMRGSNECVMSYSASDQVGEFLLLKSRINNYVPTQTRLERRPKIHSRNIYS